MTNQPPRHKESQSAAKVLAVMKVLTRNFAHGFSPTELARETGYSPSDITRYIGTLESAGFAQRITETGRIRPSVWFAQSSLAMLQSLDSAQQRMTELQQRITKGK
jgi:DNA-binding IclR family transcriptional regulator